MEYCEYCVYKVIYNDLKEDIFIFIRENNNKYKNVSFLQNFGFFYLKIYPNCIPDSVKIYDKKEVTLLPIPITSQDMFKIKRILFFKSIVPQKEDFFNSQQSIQPQTKSLSLP